MIVFHMLGCYLVHKLIIRLMPTDKCPIWVEDEHEDDETAKFNGLIMCKLSIVGPILGIH